MSLSKPDASMLSVASTMTLLRTPEMLRLAQWPVSTTWLPTPLTLTCLSLHTTVRVSLIPATLRLFPADVVVGAPAEVCGIVPEGVGLSSGKLGNGNMEGSPLRETCCALK